MIPVPRHIEPRYLKPWYLKPWYLKPRKARKYRRRPLWALVCLAVMLAACAGPYRVQEYQTDLRCLDCPVISVTRVIDGDTFVSPARKVRLFGIDAPERGMPCFDEAKTALRQLAGRRVRVESGPRPADPVGRRLFYTYTFDGNSIDEILVGAGLGQRWTAPRWPGGKIRVYGYGWAPPTATAVGYRPYQPFP